MQQTAAGAVVDMAAQASKDFEIVKSTATLRMEQVTVVVPPVTNSKTRDKHMSYESLLFC